MRPELRAYLRALCVSWVVAYSTLFMLWWFVVALRPGRYAEPYWPCAGLATVYCPLLLWLYRAVTRILSRLN